MGAANDCLPSFPFSFFYFLTPLVECSHIYVQGVWTCQSISFIYAGSRPDGRQSSASLIAHRSLPGNKTLTDLHQLFVQRWSEVTPLEVPSTKPPPRLLLLVGEAEWGADGRPVALFVFPCQLNCSIEVCSEWKYDPQQTRRDASSCLTGCSRCRNI